MIHAIAPLHHAIEGAAHAAAQVPAFGGVLRALVSFVLNALSGIVTGALVLIVVLGIKRILKARAKK